MFSKKKTKDKEVGQSKTFSKNISKQFKNLMGRKKPHEADNASHATSDVSNTDSSVASLGNADIVNNSVSKEKDELNGYSVENCEELTFPMYQQPLTLPVIGPFGLLKPLDFTIARKTSGDFGFVLRRGSAVERYAADDGRLCESKNEVIFAEPVNMARDSFLLPGDKLIKVNSKDVQRLNREDIIGVIKSCGLDVTLSVHPASECLEFSFRRFSNISDRFVNVRSWLTEKKGFSGLYKDLYNKIINNFESLPAVNLVSKIQMSSTSKHPSSDKIWINFIEGFAGGYLIKKQLDIRRCIVKLDSNDAEIEVNEEDIELANSPQFDLEENLVFLPHLNESSLIFNIWQRFGSNLIHTYVGRHIVFVNPMNNLNCFTEKVMHLFKSSNPEDLPPHIYSVAQNAFQNLKLKRQDQSICIMGRSGSGKSTVLKHLINFIINIASVNSKCNITTDRLHALWVLIDAFTCTRTGINTNASRCGKIISLDFNNINHNLTLVGMNLQIFLLDKYRIVRRPEKEPTFHVFYDFLAGTNATQIEQYELKHLSDTNSFMTPLQRENEKRSASEKWQIICQAATALDISDKEWDVICRILAAIVHLGSAKPLSTCADNGRVKWTFENRDALKRAALILCCSEEALIRAIFEFSKENLEDNESANESGGIKYNATDLLKGFVSGLYSDAIEMILSFINRCFSIKNYRTTHSIKLVDPPGFQVPTVYDKFQFGSYEDLIYNYAYERLSELNVEHNLLRPKQMFEAENIHLDMLKEPYKFHSVLPLLDDHFHSSGMKTTLFNLIENEAVTGNENSLKKKLNVFVKGYTDKVSDKRNLAIKSFNKRTGDLVISHCNCSQTLKYNVNNWLKYCRELPTINSSESLLSLCLNGTIQDILTSMNHKGVSDYSNIKYYSNKSIFQHSKMEMDYVINSLTKIDNLSFIYCVSPIPNSGLCQLKDSVDKATFDENVSCGSLFSVPLVKIQLSAFHLLPILRSFKIGYPESLTISDFYNLVKTIIPEAELSKSTDLNAEDISKMLNILKVNSKKYQIGKSRIFFRHGTIFDLQNNKELASTAFIIKFQSLGRRYLAMKQIEKLRMQNDAIRIIQRNAINYLKIREWSWWKLFTNIRPLLSVLRTEEEFTLLKSTIEKLQISNKKMDLEINSLKKENKNLEDSVDELKNEKIMFRQQMEQLSNLLEDKKIQQIKLEKEIEECRTEMAENQVKIKPLEQKSESFDDLDDTDGFKLNKSDSANFQMENILKESIQQKEKLEIELERSRIDCSKLQSKYDDVLFQMENSMTGDELNDKCQNYESEIARLQKLLSKENACRDKISRERDMIFSEKIQLEDELEKLRKENSDNLAALQSISEPFDETFGEDRDNAIRKLKYDYEQRIRNLEEEIDDATDSLEAANQEVLKFKVQVERLNQEKTNDLLDRENEIDQLKSSHARKIKNLELQLDEDRVKRQNMLKDKREADRIVLELREQLEFQKDHRLEKKLKRDLKVAKDQLNEALDQIEMLKNRKEDRSELKEMRDKLDSAEFAKELILKEKNNKERELDDLKHDLNILTKAKDELEIKLKAVKSELDSVHQLNEELELKVEELERKTKNYQSQLAAVHEEKRQLEEKTEQLEICKQDLKDRIDKLERENDTIRLDQGERSETIRLKSKLSELELKLQMEESAKCRLVASCEKLKDQLFDLQTEKESFHSKEGIESEKSRKLQKQLREARDTIESLTQEVTEKSMKVISMTDRVGDLEEEVERKNVELSLAQQKTDRLEQLLNDDDDDDDDDDLSDPSFNEVISKADQMIKNRKFSVDMSLSHQSRSHDLSPRRNSFSFDRYTTAFDDSNDQY